MSTSSPGRNAPAAGDRATRPSGRLTPATHFVRAATCFAVAKAVQTSQGPTSAEVVARSWYPTDPVTAHIVRAGTSPAAVSTDGFASEIAGAAFADFALGLVPLSAAAGLFRKAVSVDFDGRASAALPSISAGASAAFVGENAPLPVSSAGFSTVPISPRKLGVLACLTRETLRRSTAEQAVRVALSEAVARGIDEALFDDGAADDTRPAGLRHGIAATSALPGGDATSVREDVASLIAGVAGVAGGQIALVCGPVQGLKITSEYPSLPYPVFISGHIGSVVLAVALPALVASFGSFEVDASKEAGIHMSDAPLPIRASGTTADPVASMFQVDAVALRVLAEVAWALRAAPSATIAWLTASW